MSSQTKINPVQETKAPRETKTPDDAIPVSFLTNKLPPSTYLFNECYNKSAELSKASIERNISVHYTGDDPTPHPCLCVNALGWDLKSCSRCYKDRGLIRLEEEIRLQIKAQEEDRLQVESQPHAERIHSLGITVNPINDNFNNGWNVSTVFHFN